MCQSDMQLGQDWGKLHVEDGHAIWVDRVTCQNMTCNLIGSRTSCMLRVDMQLGRGRDGGRGASCVSVIDMQLGWGRGCRGWTCNWAGSMEITREKGSTNLCEALSVPHRLEKKNSQPI